MSLPSIPSGRGVQFLSGDTVRALFELAGRIANISVSSPLTLRNSSQGIAIGFDHPLVQFSVVKVTGPVELEGVAMAGRYLANPFHGPARADADGDLVADDLGNVEPNTTVEVWNLAELTGRGDPLVEEDVVFGWMYGNRDSAGDARMIMLVDVGAKSDDIWIRIISSSSIGPNRWSYAWTEQRLTRYGQWEDKPAGKTSAGSGIVAYNSAEANNAAAGVQGNGVNVDTLPEGMSIQPIRGNPVYKATFVLNCASEDSTEETPLSDYQELIFSAENAVDGECT